MAKKNNQIQGVQILSDDSCFKYYEETKDLRNTEVDCFTRPSGIMEE